MQSQIPKDYKDIGEAVMSNFDHKIDEGIATQLRDKPLYSQYAGGNFCGYVWCDHQERKYKCEVWTWGSPKEVIETDNLEEIMSIVCEKYGGE